MKMVSKDKWLYQFKFTYADVDKLQLTLHMYIYTTSIEFFLIYNLIFILFLLVYDSFVRRAILANTYNSKATVMKDFSTWNENWHYCKSIL